MSVRKNSSKSFTKSVCWLNLRLMLGSLVCCQSLLSLLFSVILRHKNGGRDWDIWLLVKVVELEMIAFWYAEVRLILINWSMSVFLGRWGLRSVIDWCRLIKIVFKFVRVVGRRGGLVSGCFEICRTIGLWFEDSSWRLWIS